MDNPSVFDRDRIEVIPGFAFGILNFRNGEDWRYTRSAKGHYRIYRWTRFSFGHWGWKRIALADVPRRVKRGIGLLTK